MQGDPINESLKCDRFVLCDPLLSNCCCQFSTAKQMIRQPASTVSHFSTKLLRDTQRQSLHVFICMGVAIEMNRLLRWSVNVIGHKRVGGPMGFERFISTVFYLLIVS